VPGIINLLPDDLSKPKRSGPEEVIPVDKSALPDFGAPAHLMPNDFWSNLKQFLTERPVKIVERSDVPFTKNSFGSGLGENLKFFMYGPKARKGPVNKRLEVDWGGNFGGFMGQLKEFFSPTRAVMPAGIKPIKVKEIWSKDENFGWTQAIALAVHGCIIALLIVPFLTNMLPTTTQAKNKLDVTPLDISPYVAKLPAGAKQAASRRWRWSELSYEYSGEQRLAAQVHFYAVRGSDIAPQSAAEARHGSDPSWPAGPEDCIQSYESWRSSGSRSGRFARAWERHGHRFRHGRGPRSRRRRRHGRRRVSRGSERCGIADLFLYAQPALFGRSAQSKIFRRGAG
jgi:hypothetical protein